MRKLLWLLLLLPALAHSQSLINCGPGVPCTITGPSLTGTGDPAWLFNGKTNAVLKAFTSAVAYGADPTGVLDSTNAIAAAEGTVAATCGTVLLPPGTYLTSATLPIVTCVTYSGYGATINYSGTGNALATPATGAPTNCGILGLTINLQSASATALRLGSAYRCQFRDIRITGTNGTTNIAILVDTNTTGTVNPAGNLNTAFNTLDNIIVEDSVGTGIRFIGTSASNVVTLNTIINFHINGGSSNGGASVAGIDYNQWCDSNVFTGDIRIGLNATSPANGIGLVLGDGGNGVYAEVFQELAIDTFGAPGTDNRQGVWANGNLVKFVVIGLLEYGPDTGGGALTNLADLQSYWINQAPRAATNYESIHCVGCNLGIGVQAFTNAQLAIQNAGQSSGANQYNVFSQSPGFNSGSPSTVAGIASQPGLASSASPYTVPFLMGFYAPTGALGTNATATNAYSYYDQGQTVGTNNFGYYSAASAAAGHWAFYGAGSAASAFGGAVESIGGPFSVSGCGTAGSVTGGAIAGSFTVGTGATPCTFTITLPAANHGWTCTATDVSKNLPLAQTAGGSTTSCLVTSSINGTSNAVGTGDNITFNAIGY